MNMQERIAGDIAKCGFCNMVVADPEGTFAYTIGLTELGHPEIFISGLSGENCHGLLWGIYYKIKEGRQFVAGEYDETIGNLPVAFRTVTDEAASTFCCQALYYYEDRALTPTFLQMVLPDQNGALPWQPGYDAEYMWCQRQCWVGLN